MKLFEYEAKNIFKDYHILVPKGMITDNPKTAGDIFCEIGKPVMLKSQVLSSGRGKAGGLWSSAYR